MGSDIVRAAVFLDYEPSDYRGRHRRPSELQGGDPLVLARAVASVQRTEDNTRGCCNCPRNACRLCRVVTISTDNLVERSRTMVGLVPGSRFPFPTSQRHD
jgi:hypothetical protein